MLALHPSTGFCAARTSSRPLWGLFRGVAHPHASHVTTSPCQEVSGCVPPVHGDRRQEQDPACWGVGMFPHHGWSHLVLGMSPQLTKEEDTFTFTATQDFPVRNIQASHRDAV